MAVHPLMVSVSFIAPVGVFQIAKTSGVHTPPRESLKSFCFYHRNPGKSDTHFVIVGSNKKVLLSICPAPMNTIIERITGIAIFTLVISNLTTKFQNDHEKIIIHNHF